MNSPPCAPVVKVAFVRSKHQGSTPVAEHFYCDTAFSPTPGLFFPTVSRFKITRTFRAFALSHVSSYFPCVRAKPTPERKYTRETDDRTTLFPGMWDSNFCTQTEVRQPSQQYRMQNLFCTKQHDAAKGSWPGGVRSDCRRCRWFKVQVFRHCSVRGTFEYILYQGYFPSNARATFDYLLFAR